MGISTFPAPSGDSGLTNDFTLDKNDTTNNGFLLGRTFAAGGYSVVVTGSTAYDVYLLDEAGSAVGYTNGTSIIASAQFTQVSALGLGTADTISFTYGGPITNASTTGSFTGAGPYLTSISPSDLPQIDDTAIVAGGNFASDVEVSFISGTVTKAAKNVVVGSSTALVVTRPDDLIEDLAPYDLQAVNPGVQSPTSSGLNVLSGTVTAGTDPSFVTTSPILGAFSGTAFSTAILTSDSEGTVVNWQITAGTLPSGLSLATATGAISGTPSADGDYYFTVQITDDGGNTNSAEFNLPVGLQVSGGASTAVGGTTYVYFTSSDDLVTKNASTMEYLVIAGGGAGGFAQFNFVAGGGGGAGGLLTGTAAPSSGTVAVTVGAGGATTSSNGSNGVDSVLAGYATATGGGGGGKSQTSANSGGSGGGGGSQGGSPGGSGGAGVAGQGFAGGSGIPDNGGGGGGASAAGTATYGGDGLDFGAWASAIGIIHNGGYFAGGGAGGSNNAALVAGGLGGGGAAGTLPGVAGSASSGGGGGGGPEVSGGGSAGAGGSGLVVVRLT